MAPLTHLARLASSRPRRVLAVTAACFLVAVAFGAPAPGLLRGGHDFEDPGSEAALARERLEAATGTGAGPGLIALVELRAPIDSQPSRARVAQSPRPSRAIPRLRASRPTTTPRIALNCRAIGA